MADGIRRHTGSTLGVGITGIAGPGGGTPESRRGLCTSRWPTACSLTNAGCISRGSRSGALAGFANRAGHGAPLLYRCLPRSPKYQGISPVRLFVALDLNEQVRTAIANFSEELRRACPSAKWVRVEGMHVTLKFIGWIADERLVAIQQGLTEVRSAARPSCIFAAQASFPMRNVRASYGSALPQAQTWQNLPLRSKLASSHWGLREKREFRPHLTLARFDAPHGIDPLLKILRDIGEVDFGTVRTTEFYLYQSELLRGGAKYTRVASFPFVPERVS